MGEPDLSQHPWMFWPPEREKEQLFVSFLRRGLRADLDILPVLETLQAKFGANVDWMPPSPYNIMYVLAVRGISVTLVDDNWPCPYFVAADSDEAVFMQLLEDLRAELGGEWTA